MQKKKFAKIRASTLDANCEQSKAHETLGVSRQETSDNYRSNGISCVSFSIETRKI